jgi:hypothetical protein
MGALHLEGVGPIVIDDELLDHVFTVITTKLRRHEPVLLSWIDETGQEQRVFLTHITSIRAEFDTAERTPRDKHWLDRLMVAVNSNAGLSLSAAIADRDTDRIPTEALPPHPRRTGVATSPAA